MDLQLKDQVIIVTGGSSGIGQGISMTLAREGAILFLVGRNEANLRQVTADLQELGTQAAYAVAELTDPEQCRRAVRAAVDTFGTVHALVNNAGVNDGVGLENGNYEDFMLSLQRNVVHYYLMAQLTLPYLKENRGAILNIGSKTSVTGQGGTSGYAAANGGRNALTREWAVELLPYGIRVNALIVAECYTPLYERWISTFDRPEEKLREITEKIPLGNRMTISEELGDAAAFLLSPRSSHTTGQLIFVDGGYTHLDRALSTNDAP